MKLPLNDNHPCIFCESPPKTTVPMHLVKELSAGTLYLSHDQCYTGYCILVFNRRHVTGLEQLTEGEHQALMSDLALAAKTLVKVFQPDHMNYAAMGNVVPHLHIHLIPRYKTDPRWGKPTWTDENNQAQKYLSATKYEEMVNSIRSMLEDF